MPKRAFIVWATTAGIAALPPCTSARLCTFPGVTAGLAKKSISIAGGAAQLVTRWRSMSMSAASRSQRGSITTVAPSINGTCMPFCIPSAWNRGAMPRNTASLVRPRHATDRRLAACSVPCVCMQPFGRPVVPEV